MANFLGRLQTFLFGAAIGRAASDSVTPVLEPVKQAAWKANENKVLDAGTAAEALAQGIITETEGQYDANRTGYSNNRFGVLWRLAQAVPGIGEARMLRRRADGSNGRLISAEQLHHVYAKNQIEPQFWPALDAVVFDILSPGELAAAIHRGLVPDPGGLLKGEQPSPPFNVEAYPVYQIDAQQEAMGSGYNLDRLGVLVGLQGLPMGTHEAAQAFFRGIITHGDYIRAFNESNSRNEWAQAVLDQTRQIPTARDFFENALRGHHDFEWAAQQAARHGMSPEDSFVIYQNQGRPLNLHQITQALAWGAKYKPAPTDNPDPWVQSVLLGPVRPEYYDLNEALKYTLPSAFYFRTLQEQGVLKEPEAAMWYRRLGWPPELADLVATAYASTTAAAKPDPWVAKSDTQLWTATHKAYKGNAIDAQTARTRFDLIGISAAAQDEILTRWDSEKSL